MELRDIIEMKRKFAEERSARFAKEGMQSDSDYERGFATACSHILSTMDDDWWKDDDPVSPPERKCICGCGNEHMTPIDIE